MNDFANIFASTDVFLRSKGVSPEVSKAKGASHVSVEKFHKQTGISLPASYSAFYTDFADGFDFRWRMAEKAWGVFSIPSLHQLTVERQTWEQNIQSFLSDSGSLDRCVEPQFRAEAFEIWRMMRSWVPLYAEGDGNHFCVDTSTGRIVYDQQDWFDGFGLLAKTNGIIAGESLLDFLENWSQFCFQRNKRLWWGEFAKFGVIKWEPTYFNTDFYRGHKTAAC